MEVVLSSRVVRGVLSLFQRRLYVPRGPAEAIACTKMYQRTCRTSAARAGSLGAKIATAVTKQNIAAVLSLPTRESSTGSS